MPLRAVFVLLVSMSVDLDNALRYNGLEFRTSAVVEGFITGLHRSPFHGFSVEFAEHRLYNSGESTRHIDWKLYAKTDKLFVKKYEEETNLRCTLALDVSRSMYFPTDRGTDFDSPNKLAFSVYAAGCLAHLLYKQRDAFSLAFLSEGIDLLSEIKTNSAHRKYVFTLLEQLLTRPMPQSGLTSIDKPLHELAEKLHRRSLVVIFTDLFSTLSSIEDLAGALQHLRYNRHEVVLFHVNDRRLETDLDFEKRPCRFVDLESGEEIKANPLQIRQAYKAEVQKQTAAIKSWCNNLRVDFVEADIREGFDRVMLPFLLKRSRLK